MFSSTLVYATKCAHSECQHHWPEYGGRDCLTDCDTTNVPICRYHGKVVPIKLIEHPYPLVHLHSNRVGKQTKYCSSQPSVT